MKNSPFFYPHENLPIDRQLTAIERIDLKIAEAENMVVYGKNKLESLHREKDKLETKEKENQ